MILFLGLNCYAQEYLTGFSYEAKAKAKAKAKADGEGLRRGGDVLSLPFFDDFTGSDIYADDYKWQNSNVLVNSGFPIMPTNFNVATFDVLDADGKVYSHASSTAFIADSLMSKPISLKDLTPADSLYLSFYYQPQGNGDAPEETDSLVLMIGYTSDSTMKWSHVWSTEGITLDSFLIANDSNYFKQVMIPIKDEVYFGNDIVILFYNYGSLTTSMYPNDRSNVDTWNIDFVYLDKNRSVKNTSYPMVTFVEKSPSLLKRYQSMPYRQYVNNPTFATVMDFEMSVVNLDTVTVKAKYTCNVSKIDSDWSYDYKDASFNVMPYANNGIVKNTFNDSKFLFDIDDKADSASYLITHIISLDESASTKGDTLYGKQIFKNYYAYDDGTPERGYGVNPGESCFASQFSISKMDTLCGVYLLFNRTYNDANYDFFDIVVWHDNFGRPGNEIYRLKNQRPVWNDSTIYEFAYYPFDKMLKVNGTIYVGIMQHSDESINIGFDTSKDNSQYNFYDIGYGWENSSFKGSLMIRPVLGSDYLIEEEMSLTRDRLVLYPNPSQNEINISELDADECKEVMIYDMTGRLMKQFNNIVKMDVTDLPNGLYMMRVVTEEGKRYTEKFMISK